MYESRQGKEVEYILVKYDIRIPKDEFGSSALFMFLVDKWKFVEVRVYRERSEPNSEPRSGAVA